MRSTERIEERTRIAFVHLRSMSEVDLPRFGRDVNGHLEYRTGYLRCPTCGLIAQPTSMSYRNTPDGHLDGNFPIEVTCPFDFDHRHLVTSDAFLPWDGVATCQYPNSCGTTTFAVPAAADEVECPECGRRQEGPAVDDQRRLEIKAAWGEHEAALRSAIGYWDPNRDSDGFAQTS